MFRRLARDTEASERRLYECAQFYRSFPILRALAKLGWNRCRLLCQVDDEPQRLALASEALKRDWPSRELERRIREFNATQADAVAAAHANGVNGQTDVAPAPRLLTPRRGTPGLHAVIDQGDGPAVDLGFSMTHLLGPGTKLAAGEIVRFTEGGVRRVDGATRADLFTYAATVRRVIDGDTLLVAIEFAPGFRKQKTLRLRGLDCAETKTAAGRAAKRFVESLVAPGDEVVLSTTKPDKYDRSLADVFVRAKSGGESREPGVKPTGDFVFLNNALLENGHAERYDGGPKDE